MLTSETTAASAASPVLGPGGCVSLGFFVGFPGLGFFVTGGGVVGRLVVGAEGVEGGLVWEGLGAEGVRVGLVCVGLLGGAGVRVEPRPGAGGAVWDPGSTGAPEKPSGPVEDPGGSGCAGPLPPPNALTLPGSPEGPGMSPLPMATAPTARAADVARKPVRTGLPERRRGLL
ncbi:hypothetical protein GCM10012280_47220 [Wenjunlia tyrosinilytica]|uniref:Uncharacterized protein n=1 Tax=Wenjunlia tyrosinilytica TaxID=1544741 RepID=A0A917ZVD3_9ACTN|nr:hypothetical protein GCM10012280_47220 [Wenjunlia tyrosinilytica]